jgi:hypothetical protein
MGLDIELGSVDIHTLQVQPKNDNDWETPSNGTESTNNKQ